MCGLKINSIEFTKENYKSRIMVVTEVKERGIQRGKPYGGEGGYYSLQTKYITNTIIMITDLTQFKRCYSLLIL